MLVFFVRHGESENNRLADAENDTNSDATSAGRQADPPLTQAGIAAGVYCANWLKAVLSERLLVTGDGQAGVSKLRIACSPMRRAMQSAAIIAQAVPAQVHVFPDICEAGGLFGGCRDGEHGKAKEEVFPGVTAECIREEYKNQFIPHLLKPGGWWNKKRESMKEAAMRAEAYGRQLAAASCGAEIEDIWIVITHGLFYDLLLKSVLGISSSVENEYNHFRDAPVYFMLENWAVSLLQFLPNEKLEGEAQVVVHCLNNAAFLPNELRRSYRLGPRLKSIL